MITTVIFDLGGVLVRFKPEEGMRSIGFSEEAIAVFNEKIFSGVWESCDKKRYEPSEIRAYFKSLVPGYEKEVDRLWDQLPAVTGVLPHTKTWLKKLKAEGLKLYVLSNYGNVSFSINSKGYDFLDLMDGMVISYELEEIKPDPPIYTALLTKYGIDPAEAVFIDDRQINVDGAKALGMKGILFENYEQADGELQKLIRA